MNLAARCPACGTVFRVVQDQLRVSDGWVRCGRCSEVFNALDGLVDLDAPDAALPPATLAAARPALPARDEIEAPPPAPPAAVPREPPPAVSEAPIDVATAAPVAGSAAVADRIGLRAEPFFDAPPESAAPPVAPTFVRRADRAARWRRPAVRAALAAVVLVAGLALAAQAAWVWRDALAARVPALRGALAELCGTVGCRVEPLRAIESLAVESTSLVRVEGTSMVRLGLVVRNRAAWPVALPAVDLTLTDAQGGVVARRVLDGADFGSAATTVPAAAVTSLQATLLAGERPPAGYTIEIFYP